MNNSTGGCPKCAGQAACWCPPVTDPLTQAVEAMGLAHCEMQQLCGHGASDKELLTAALPALERHFREKLAGELREFVKQDVERYGGAFFRGTHTIGQHQGWKDAADHLVRPEVMG